MSTILQKQIGTSPGAGLALTPSETHACYTGRCAANLPTMKAIIKAWALFVPGAACTGLSLRIRRGFGLNGPFVLLGGIITCAPATMDDTWLVATESLANVEYVDYSLAILPNGASSNGTIVQSSIEVELING
jgi:hypothetical protein